jgi:hypothetical protein
MKRREITIIILVALTITAGLYAWIGVRAARATQITLEELRSVKSHLESLAKTDVPQNASEASAAILKRSDDFKMLFPVLSRGEKRLSSRGLGKTQLYAGVSKMLWDFMDFKRKQKSRDAQWALGKLRELQADAAALNTLCEQE